MRDAAVVALSVAAGVSCCLCCKTLLFPTAHHQQQREQLSIKCCCAAKKEEIQLHGVGVGKSHRESSAAGSNETQNRVEDINYNSARSDYDDIHL